MQKIVSLRKFFRMSELWKMGTMRWTSTYEKGFEGLQPVRLTVSPSHRRRYLNVVCCGCLCWGFWFGVFVVFVCFWKRSFCFDLSSLMSHNDRHSCYGAHGNRSKNKHHILFFSLSVICTCYYDDFPTCISDIAALTSRCMSLLLNLLGWEHAQSGNKGPRLRQRVHSSWG